MDEDEDQPHLVIDAVIPLKVTCSSGQNVDVDMLETNREEKPLVSGGKGSSSPGNSSTD